ncbi:hypothetical protein [Cohnella sp. 56]|uniref:hypothetical protein n=1 Tax=Cohnella sp. 56 TaxID=3113722 RepID=UPI0030E81084
MSKEAASGLEEQLFRQLRGLPGEKRQKLIDDINRSLDIDEATIRERTHANRLRCPHCGTTGQIDNNAASNVIICYGNVKPGSKRQRYMCKSCKSYFNDHTGTALHKTKKLKLWPVFLKYLLDGLPIRRVARETGISPTTAQAWRKKLLTHLAEKQQASLSGIVEYNELAVKASRKGQRKPRTSDSEASKKLIFCKSRGGNASVTLCSLQELKQQFAEAVNLWHSELAPATPASSAERKLLHTKLAAPFAGRFAEEYARMRGTASDYLPLYAAWHQFQDETQHFTLRERIRRLLFAGL